MSKDNSELNKTVLQLPVDNDDLANFIGGLLGQSSTFEKAQELEFDINLDWVIDLFHTIDQRVRQNDSNFIYFRAAVTLDDKRRRTFNSIDAFTSYRERNLVKSSRLSIDLSYLIQFPSKSTPEKQIIRIDMNENGSCDYRIDFTDHTWGYDIENILINKIDTAKRSPRFESKLITSLRVFLILSSFFVVFYGCTVLLDYFTNSLDNDALIKLSDQLENSPVNMKHDLYILGEFLFINRDSTVIGLHFIFFFLSLFVAGIITALTERNKHSFVNLNEQANKYRKETLKIEERKFMYLVIGYIFSISASILAAYISKSIGI